MAKGKGKPEHKGPPRITNRRARHDFHIVATVECGMELVGTEVKSLRAGQAKIDESYARVWNGQAFLVGANIAAYPHAAPTMQHDPSRNRRLLAHRRQIVLMDAHVRQKGNTIVPLAIYFKGPWAKCELGLAVGKRSWDKRQAIKDRQAKRDMDREMRRRR